MVSAFLLCAAAIGVALLVGQRLAIAWHLRAPRRAPARRRSVAILKPLCGVDEGLAESLEAFASLDYPRFELLLGLESTADPTWPLAKALEQRFPSVVRVALRRSQPGLNPKVNQLVTLEALARHELIVVSDSNTRPPPGYLDELSGWFDDEQIVCVTHPVSGVGQRSLGALLDNLHLASAIGAGQVAAKVVANKNLVVGKSMALRRSTLDALGGFGAFKDHLAEDYAIGRAVDPALGKVAVSALPILNVAVRRSVGSFWQRYARWSVIHRTAVSLGTYLGQALLNPWPLSLVAAAIEPSSATVAASAATLVLKSVIDVSSARALGFGPGSAAAYLCVPVKDLLLFFAWLRGLVVRTVSWRGKPLRVEAGSRLVAAEAQLEPSPAEGAR
jgi:ceramide glucosyltransferase